MQRDSELVINLPGRRLSDVLCVFKSYPLSSSSSAENHKAFELATEV